MAETVCQLLEDGQWHAFEEIRNKHGFSERKLQEILSFLKTYDIIAIDAQEKKVKMDSSFFQLPK